MFLTLFVGCEEDRPGSDEPVTDVCEAGSIELVRYWESGELPQRYSVAHTEPGVALGDMDLDGDLDGIVAWGGGVFLLDNDGAGALTVDDSWTVDGDPLPDASAVALADLDDDGDLDVWLGRERDQNAVFLYTEGPGSFTGVTIPGGTTAAATGAFADADGDGDLDIAVANLLTNVDPQLVLDGSQQGIGNHLWTQDAGTWDAPVALPAEQAASLTFQAAWIDAEGDGDLDLYLGNVWGFILVPNQLFLNDGAGNFTLAEGVAEKGMNSMGVAVGDANGDGHPDMYISDVGSGTMFYNAGDGTFYEATAASGTYVAPSDTNLSGWGTTFYDFDLDGCEDLLVTYGRLAEDGELELEQYEPEGEDWADPDLQANVLLVGDCEGHFERLTGSAFDTTLLRDRGAAVGDLDGDLRPDVLTVGKFDVHQWRATGGCAAGVKLRLAGPAGNTNGFGARVDFDVAGRTGTRWMLPGVTHSQNALELVLGLGVHPTADIRVTWPDGSVSTWDDVAAGTTLVATP